MRTNPLGIPIHDTPAPVARFRPGGIVPTGRVWHCASRHCTAAARTYDAKVPYHKCPEMNGMVLPLVPDDERGKVGHRVIERADDVGGDLVQPVTDRRGRLVMAVEHHRDDGYSTTVYAPTATASADEIREATADGRNEG